MNFVNKIINLKTNKMKNLIEKTKDGVTIIFFKENSSDTKFSWKIKNDPELTKLLLQNSKNKKVKDSAIFFAEKGIFEKIANRDNLKSIYEQTSNNNSVVELGLLCQKIFRKNIKTDVVKITGLDHARTVYVKIILPDGKVFESSASNQKKARQKAALEALEAFKK
jgi:hypothetical protein